MFYCLTGKQLVSTSLDTQEESPLFIYGNKQKKTIKKKRFFL